MRPFGAITSGEFADTCTRCGDCAAVCPQAIITADDEGFPIVDLTRRECTFCGECATACEAGAIVPATGWEWRAKVGETCLSLQAVACRTCEDHCDERAIRFQLQTGGRSQPIIDIESCTGCGACSASCPSGAISFEMLQGAEQSDFNASNNQPASIKNEHMRMSGPRDA
ncbi:ferredoxin-type protein NapF [Shimia haliotis]|uniref:Ferredoxin-type protein NapF n=2 Tax=Shimia haliotis TaxID=1280847 RepID=A0A1I3ZY31_9RHOB|nr:ferredoxin-type protein NapF [Shimia haliotis]